MTGPTRTLVAILLSTMVAGCAVDGPSNQADADRASRSVDSKFGTTTRSGWYLHADGTLDTPRGTYESMKAFLEKNPWEEGLQERCFKAERTVRARGLGFAAEPPRTAAPGDCTNTFTNIETEYQLDGTGTKLVVPVVFHNIMRDDDTGYLSAEQLLSQIQVLNEDYAALVGTPGGDSVLANDTNIEFVLAGIDRHANDAWFNDPEAYEEVYKQALNWDVDEYLNIYTVGPFGALGWAYTPDDAAGVEELDGVVVDFQFVGKDSGAPPYDQGRTITHEVGHYLGLEHTFHPNDGDGVAGVCENGWDEGDLIAGTPAQPEPDYGCPAPGDHSTCDAADPTHNITNYMNYTDDTCMGHLTVEQANRAVCGLVNYRPDLYLSVDEDARVTSFASDSSLFGYITHPFIAANTELIVGGMHTVPRDAAIPPIDAHLQVWDASFTVLAEDYSNGLDPAFATYFVPQQMSPSVSVSSDEGAIPHSRFAIYVSP